MRRQIRNAPRFGQPMCFAHRAVMYRHRTRTLFLFTCAVRVVVACLAALPCLASPCFASPAPEPRFRVLQPARHDSSPAARLHLAAHGRAAALGPERMRLAPWLSTHRMHAAAVSCWLHARFVFAAAAFLHRIALHRRAVPHLALRLTPRFASPGRTSECVSPPLLPRPLRHSGKVVVRAAHACLGLSCIF